MSALIDLVQSIILEEEETFKKLNLESYIFELVSKPDGLKRFAESFYFVRYDFYRLNFIVGERCSTNEFLWAGLVRSLMEELGGNDGISHNQMYKDFMTCVEADPNISIPEPLFAQEFNNTWQEFCRHSPLPDALAAIAIYEILDQPDYQLLLNVVEKAGVGKRGLIFFKVHAKAEHFSMFEDIVSWLSKQEGGQQAIENGRNFVMQTQIKMWVDLLAHLEQQSANSEHLLAMIH